MTGRGSPIDSPASPRHPTDTWSSVHGRRVLLIFQPEVGGVPQYVGALAEGLATRGWVVTAAAPSRSPVRERLARCAHVVPFDTSSAPGVRDPVLAARLASACRSRGIELIHAHSSKAGAVTALASLIGKTPSIYSPHVWSFQREQSAAACRTYELVERSLMRVHRHAIAVAESERVDAITRRVVSSGRIDLVDTGLPDARVPRREVARSQLGYVGPEFALGWVGRFAPQKRTEDLIELRVRLDAACGMIVLGHGMPDSPAGRELRERGAVVTSHADPSVVYGACDVLVVTSRWEAAPMVVLEAMRAGRPVVAYDVGGIADQIEHGRTGFLVPSGDVDGLARRVRQLADDPRGRIGMGVRARERFEARFGAERMIDAISDCYVRVLSRRSPSS